MKIVAVDYVTTANRYTVYFTAPHRVDFRQLVRDMSPHPVRPRRAAPAHRPR